MGPEDGRRQKEEDKEDDPERPAGMNDPLEVEHQPGREGGCRF